MWNALELGAAVWSRLFSSWGGKFFTPHWVESVLGKVEHYGSQQEYGRGKWTSGLPHSHLSIKGLNLFSFCFCLVYI